GQVLKKVYAVQPGEGVFAYARISPDGALLAYASEKGAPPSLQTINRSVRVIEIETGRVAFTEPGVDAYWSPDGKKLIYESFLKGKPSVSVWERSTGRIRRNVAPVSLGDYYSWGQLNGHDVIVTVESNFYQLVNGSAVLPVQRVPFCSGIGVG